MASHLAANGLEKSYRKGKNTVPVLRGVDLSVARGELVAIVGASGSGKSTLLHVLGLLDAPDAGQVRLDGGRIDNRSDRDRDELRNRTFGFIFQFYHLLPELSALENVMMPQLIRHGLWSYLGQRRTLRAEATALLERVGLGHRLDHRPSELSGGEMQRAAIARALAGGPSVLLADEPTGNLDAATGQGVLELLGDLNRERRLTMILVTHDAQIAQKADRVVRLAEGRIEEWAPSLPPPWRDVTPRRMGRAFKRLRIDRAPHRGGSCTRMSLKIYIGGKLYDKADAKISVYDHGLLYGDGVFEGIRAYSGRVFRLDQHVDRLYDSAQSIHLRIPMAKAEMSRAINETLAVNKLSDAYIRVVVTRGAGSLGLDPRKTTDPQIIIIADAISLYPAELYEHGLKIITAGTLRNHPSALNPRIKSLNYLNNIMAKVEGTNAGCLEALMLNHKGEVAECTGDNIFVVRKGQLHTPPIDAGILEGITRDAVIELARGAGFAVFERSMDRHDVYTADECFLTGTAAEVIPVVECDGRAIGTGKPGPVTLDLLKRFHALVREER